MTPRTCQKLKDVSIVTMVTKLRNGLTFRPGYAHNGSIDILEKEKP